MKKLWQIALFILFITGCASHRVNVGETFYNDQSISMQKIVTVTPQYVVIEVDPGISQQREIVEVHRLSQRKVTRVGRVKILKYHNGKAAARILEIKEDGIKAGDFVVLNNKQFDEMNVSDFINAVKSHRSNQMAYPKS